MVIFHSNLLVSKRVYVEEYACYPLSKHLHAELHQTWRRQRLSNFDSCCCLHWGFYRALAKKGHLARVQSMPTLRFLIFLISAIHNLTAEWGARVNNKWNPQPDGLFRCNTGQKRQPLVLIGKFLGPFAWRLPWFLTTLCTIYWAKECFDVGS